MIKVVLTRCIHCTRCVRFLNEICGDYTLGMLGRGNFSEIGLYTDSVLSSELGSNITDFCPVGALTVKPYALNYRAWDDLYFESIDLSDSLCVPIRVYSNFSKIIRLLPQYNNELKLSWIHEKTRYLTDGLNIQQSKFPLMKKNFEFFKNFKKQNFFERKENLFKKKVLTPEGLSLVDETRNNFFIKFYRDLAAGQIASNLLKKLATLSGYGSEVSIIEKQSTHDFRYNLDAKKLKICTDTNFWYAYTRRDIDHLYMDKLKFTPMSMLEEINLTSKKNKFEFETMENLYKKCPVMGAKFKLFKKTLSKNFPLFKKANKLYSFYSSEEYEELAFQKFLMDEIISFSEEDDILNFGNQEALDFYYKFFVIEKKEHFLCNKFFLKHGAFWDFYLKKKIEFDLEEENLNVKNLNPTFIKISWVNLSKGLIFLLKSLSQKINFKVFLGDFLDIFTLLKVKKLAFSLGSNRIINFSENVVTASNLINEDFDANYIFQEWDFSLFKTFFLMNLNLRFENPVLNAKLRQLVIWKKNINIFFFGSKYNLTYKYIHLGTTSKLFLKIIEGRHYLINFLKKNLLKENLFLYNHELLNCYKNTSYRSLFNFLKKLNKFFIINYLVSGAGTMGAYDLSMIDSNRAVTRNQNNTIIRKKNKKEILADSFLYFLGCNKFLLNNKNLLRTLIHKLAIYHHNAMDKYFYFVDFFLPSNSYTNLGNDFYLNCFGLLKMTRQIFFPMNIWVKDNLEILEIISKIFINFLPKKVFYPAVQMKYYYSTNKLYQKTFYKWTLFFSKMELNLIKSKYDKKSLVGIAHALKEKYSEKISKDFVDLSFIFQTFYESLKNKELVLTLNQNYLDVSEKLKKKSFTKIYNKSVPEAELIVQNDVEERFFLKEKNRKKKLKELKVFSSYPTLDEYKNIFLKQEIEIKESLTKDQINAEKYYSFIRSKVMKNQKRIKVLLDFFGKTFWFEKRLFQSFVINDFFYKNLVETYIQNFYKLKPNKALIFFKNIVYVLDIFKRIPIHLYDKRRLKLFNIFDKKIFYSFFYFYLFSFKTRNFFKTNYLSQYSKNLNLMSKINFVQKSNFNL